MSQPPPPKCLPARLQLSKSDRISLTHYNRMMSVPHVWRDETSTILPRPIPSTFLVVSTYVQQTRRLPGQRHHSFLLSLTLPARTYTSLGRSTGVRGRRPLSISSTEYATTAAFTMATRTQRTSHLSDYAYCHDLSLLFH